MLQGDLVGEGNTPSAFQIYTAYAPKNFTESPYASSITLEIITSVSYQEPLQICRKWHIRRDYSYPKEERSCSYDRAQKYQQ